MTSFSADVSSLINMTTWRLKRKEKRKGRKTKNKKAKGKKKNKKFIVSRSSSKTQEIERGRGREEEEERKRKRGRNEGREGGREKGREEGRKVGRGREKREKERKTNHMEKFQFCSSCHRLKDVSLFGGQKGCLSCNLRRRERYSVQREEKKQREKEIGETTSSVMQPEPSVLSPSRSLGTSFLLISRMTSPLVPTLEMVRCLDFPLAVSFRPPPLLVSLASISSFISLLSKDNSLDQGSPADSAAPSLFLAESSSLELISRQLFCDGCKSKGMELSQSDRGEGCKVSFLFVCRKCGWDFTWTNEAKQYGESKTKKSSWLSSYVCRSFLVSGKTFSEMEHLFGIMGVNHPSEQTFFREMEKTRKEVAQILEENLLENRERLMEKGDHKAWRCTTDGFYHHRGHYSDNASAALYDLPTGKILFRAHRSRTGVDHNYSGSSKQMESDMIGSMALDAKKCGFNVSLCVMDGDSGSRNSLKAVFPKAEIVSCTNHHAKNFFVLVKEVQAMKCSCKGNCKRMTVEICKRMQASFQTLLQTCNEEETFSKRIRNFPQHYTNQHEDCEHHPKEENGKPYQSSAYFTCEIQKEALVSIIERIVENSGDYISSHGPLNTNTAEGFHGSFLPSFPILS